ncbi:putative transmembrane protein ZNF593OS [Heterodontus francisci]|uniref:putative transmembrane protein ZNF593OS n=1 Tax=Heterodontus francisci TaxID=7792 RepID=UPI00355B6C50
MILWLNRLTPSYFRLLQMQLAGDAMVHRTDRLINFSALLLAVGGIGLSSYSIRRMTEATFGTRASRRGMNYAKVDKEQMDT